MSKQNSQGPHDLAALNRLLTVPGNSPVPIGEELGDAWAESAAVRTAFGMAFLNSVDPDDLQSNPDIMEKVLEIADALGTDDHIDMLEIWHQMELAIARLRAENPEGERPEFGRDLDWEREDAAARIRRTAWSGLKSIGDTANAPPLMAVETGPAQQTDRADMRRPTFKACHWSTSQKPFQLIPAIHARELVLIVLSGTINIEVGTELSRTRRFRMSSSDKSITRLRLRAPMEAVPWVPPVHVVNSTKDARGLLIAFSELGLPFEQNQLGYVQWLDAQPSPHAADAFWEAMEDPAVNDFLLRRIDRHKRPPAKYFQRVDGDGFEFAHNRGVRNGNHELFEEIAEPALFQPEHLILKVVLTKPADTTSYAVARHEGCEFLVPLAGTMMAVFADPSALTGIRRGCDLDPRLDNERWQEANGQQIYLFAHRGPNREPDLLFVKSNEVLHGFASGCATRPAMSLFIGADQYEQTCSWHERFYAERNEVPERDAATGGKRLQLVKGGG
nr:hypothetical protein [uncultured Hyphomonas sp.]